MALTMGGAGRAASGCNARAPHISVRNQRRVRAEVTSVGLAHARPIIFGTAANTEVRHFSLDSREALPACHTRSYNTTLVYIRLPLPYTTFAARCSAYAWAEVYWYWLQARPFQLQSASGCALTAWGGGHAESPASPRPRNTSGGRWGRCSRRAWREDRHQPWRQPGEKFGREGSSGL